MRINSKLARLPRRINGKLFSVSHTSVSKSFKKAKEVIGLNNDNITPYSLRHTHTSTYYQKAYRLNILAND